MDGHGGFCMVAAEGTSLPGDVSPHSNHYNGYGADHKCEEIGKGATVAGYIVASWARVAATTEYQLKNDAHVLYQMRREYYPETL